MSKNLFSLFINSDYDFKKSLKDFRAYDAIKNSGLFDENFYKSTYPEVEGDGLTHYLTKGYKEGKYPSLDFDPEFYYRNYPSVKQENINPLLHYITYGKNEDRIYQKSYSIRRKDEITETNKAFLNNYQFENEPLVSIIILNRNGLIHLKRLFADFSLKTNYSNFEIIVVDNDSDDDSVKYLKSLELPIKIIENKTNQSFSKANNEAAKIANGDYLLLLNNDIEPTYGWLNELMGTMINNENVAIVGAKLIFPFYFNENREKSFTIQHSGDIFAERMYPCCLYAINKSNSDLDIFDESLTRINQCIAVTGAVALIKKSIYQELDGLDEAYNYGLEDVDFCLKCNKKGYKTLFCGNSLLFHHESSTRVKSKDYFENDKKNYQVFWSKWGEYLSKHLLLDKIHANKFFTEKQLKIAIVDDNKTQESRELAKQFNFKGYEVLLITDLNEHYLGDSTDILISYNENYNLDNLTSRRDVVKILIANYNNSSNAYNYDIVVNGQNNHLYELNIDSDDFAGDLLEGLENILLENDGFL